MKLKNNRRAKYEFTFGLLGLIAIILFIGWLNIINVNPRHDLIFYSALLLLLLIPVIGQIIEFILTAKTIIIEDEGVAVYKKGRRMKFLEYKDIKYIEVKKSTITIFSSIKIDFPYLHIITSVSKSLFKYLTSKDFRKRWTEYRIDFKNYKKGFGEHELPFITEIANRSGCEIKYMIRKQ